jgi:serine/threonine-protein kinase PRP4
LTFGDKPIDVGHKIRSHEEMKKGTSFEKEDHERYKEKTELTTLQQQDDARGKVEVESVLSSQNVKTGARATDTGKAAHLQNSTSGSMANGKAENKQDSQVVIINKANITVGKPPAASSTTGSGRPPPPAAAAGIRISGKPDGMHNERNAHPDNWDDAEGYYAYHFGGVAGWPL